MRDSIVVAISTQLIRHEAIHKIQKSTGIYNISSKGDGFICFFPFYSVHLLLLGSKQSVKRLA